jgi:DNA-binding transcriptional regulator YiaG
MTARQIVNLRKALGLTQQRLADLIGARQHTVARWETGMHQPRGGYLKALRELQQKAKTKKK